MFVKKSNSSSVAPCLRDARCRICMCFCIPFSIMFMVFLSFLHFFKPLNSLHPRSTLFILTSDISKLLLMLCFLGILLTFSVSNEYTNKQSQRVKKKNNINKIKLFWKKYQNILYPAYILVLSTKQIIGQKRSICVSSAVVFVVVVSWLGAVIV